MKLVIAGLASIAIVGNAARCDYGWGWYNNYCFKCVTGANGVQPQSLPDQCICPATFEYDYEGGKGCILDL